MTSGQYQRSTGRLPDWYLQQPPKSRGEDPFIQALYLLDGDRAHAGKIPFTSAARYAELLGLGAEMSGWFARVLLLLDAKFRRHKAEEAEKVRKRKERQERREELRKSR